MKKTGSVEKIADCGCGIFVYAGTTPNTELYSELELDNGFIPVDEWKQTFYVGDIREYVKRHGRRRKQSRESIWQNKKSP